MPSKDIRCSHLPKWGQIVDQYVLCADQLTNHLMRIWCSLRRSVKEENFEDLRNSFVLKVTIAGICVLFAVLLCSCQTGPRRLPLPPPSAHLPSQTTEKGDSLYVRRTTPQIKLQHEGSQSGSIFADSRRPVNFFSDQSRPLAGDFLTVAVPPELLFRKPEQSLNNGKTSQQSNPGGAAASARKKNGATTDEDVTEIIELATAQADTLSSLRMLQQQDRTQFKAQIVGIDPDGTAFIKSVHEFASPDGRSSSLTLTGRLPLSKITALGISAADLSQIELTLLEDGTPSLYQTSGWDPVVARKMSGYLPDLKNDLDTFRSLEQRIRNQQRNLTDRYRNLRREQGRFKREQGEHYDALRRRQEALAQGSPATSSGAGAPVPGGATPADGSTARQDAIGNVSSPVSGNAGEPAPGATGSGQ
jgi:hypothetical protein